MAEHRSSSRSLSEKGIEDASFALKKLCITKTDLAAQLQMSRVTVDSFLRGDAVAAKTFRKIC